MKFYRFMSDKEFKTLINGETLENSRSHSEHARSSSVGFCFVPEDTIYTTEFFGKMTLEDGSRNNIVEGIQNFLSDILGGVTTQDVLVELEGPDMPRRSIGVYADIFSDWGFATLEETSVEKYSLSTYRISHVYVRITRRGKCGSWKEWQQAV